MSSPEMTRQELEEAIERLAIELSNQALAGHSGAVALSALLSAYTMVASRHVNPEGLQECANLTMQASMWLATLANERRAMQGGVNGSVH